MHQVRYFLAVAELLNFTRAAERLHVAQPSLTRAIQKLEEELNGPLFRRERSNTHLTELGRMMLPHLQASLAAAEAAKQQAQSFHKREAGQLSVGACNTVSAELAAPLLAAVSRDMPGLEIRVEVASEGTVEERLTSGGIDVAVLAPVGELPERFDLHEMRDDPFVVAFSPGHRLARTDELSLEALDAEPLLVRASCGYEALLEGAMEARGLHRQERHRAEDGAWLMSLARAGLGVAIVPEPLAALHGLSFRRLTDLAFRHRTALATVAGRRHSPALAALVRHARATASAAAAPAG
ncbi:MAG: LysR family transcriptional regulator [Methylobacteriaceae bacterium]|nr:LysR family transcriptional regulator [Methylobacteriaceae bacterium]